MRLIVLFGQALALALHVTAGAIPVSAHGGPPLRLGVTGDPDASAAGRLVLVRLREGVGFAVDWREFPDETALNAAFVAGKLDIAVAATGPGRAARPDADCPPPELARLRAELRERWSAEVHALGFAPGPDPCRRLALVVSRAVLEDLRFGILGREAERLAAAVTREDVAAVRAAGGHGGERAATAAARAALAAKAAK